MAVVNLIGGLDIGNGYVKGMLRNEVGSLITPIDIPSGTTLVTGKNKLPLSDDEAISVVNNKDTSFYNQLDASFDTPLVGDGYRRLFGSRGIDAKGVFEEFNVEGNRSKAEQELSFILVLGLFSAKALADYVVGNGGLVPSTEVLDVHIKVALALPINEFRVHRKSFANAFMSQVHTVTIQNFQTPVTVKLTFDDVRIFAEGVSAQFAITSKGETLMNSMLKDVKRHTEINPDITAADILNARNTVGIDIGEGTVNFPVFTDGNFNADSSTTFSRGYGSVLTSALEEMEALNMNTGFTSRKQLAQYLQREPSALKRNHYAKVKMVVDEQTKFFADEVARHFGNVLSVVGATTEVIYVYGGGSGPVKDVLYDLLIAKAKEMTGAEAPLVLYLDAKYSRHLNREGLFLAAERLANSN